LSAHSIELQRVLLVDDEPMVLNAIRRAFERAGRIVTACRTFEDAREELITGDFDALLTDVRLGGFNGLQLAVVARHLDPEMRIVVFSGSDDAVLREEAARLGAAYVVKPVAPEQLLDITSRVEHSPSN
jgi:two-component system response regulator YesN